MSASFSVSRVDRLFTANIAIAPTTSPVLLILATSGLQNRRVQLVNLNVYLQAAGSIYIYRGGVIPGSNTPLVISPLNGSSPSVQTSQISAYSATAALTGSPVELMEIIPPYNYSTNFNDLTRLDIIIPPGVVDVISIGNNNNTSTGTHLSLQWEEL